MTTIQMDNAQFLPHVCQLVQEGHKVTIGAKGNSMRPFIESGRDAVVLSRLTQPVIGDVVLAELTQGHYVLHRIDAIEGMHIRLRGDGNPYQTEQCNADDLRATVVTIVRKGRSYATSSRTWKTYSWIWTRLLPLRRYLLALYRLVWRGELPARITRR
ncbi:MAG: S24/S26 family peptidase [Bacteroidaceae bacterium]|nr:S24/S26 family peptidase [Bacteroidaceae bacterium]